MIITDELKVKYQGLVDKNYTTKQIADTLKMSWSTVKRQLRTLGIKTSHYVSPDPISKENLERFISEKFSHAKISRKLGCSQSKVKHWLKHYGLKTDVGHGCYPTGDKNNRMCPQCKIQKPVNSNNFYINKNGYAHAWCRKCNDRITLEKQREVKLKAVEYRGGKCVLCGYKRCLGSLDFHHTDPTKKEFNISSLRTYSWENMKKELDKCVILCKNCHGEVHAGLVTLPVVSI